MKTAIRGFIASTALVTFAACPVDPGTSDAGDSGSDCTNCPAAICPAGFVAIDGGAGCLALLRIGACPPNQMPKLGTTDCVPVGVQSCPAGFVVDSSGWGCRDVTSAAPCTGPTREKLGETGCVPVGDCSAPFPPAGATVFVSAAYTAGQLDVSHYDNLRAAAFDAGAGAIIAVDEGTYVGTISPPRPVTIWGKCAEKVILVPTDGGTTLGLNFINLNGVVAKNLTVRGFHGGAAVGGGSAELSNLVLEDNLIAGVFATTGAQVTLRDSVVRGTRARPTDNQCRAALAQRGAVLTIEESSISNNEFVGAAAANPDAGLIVRRSIIRDTFPMAQGPSIGAFGVGAYASDSAWMRLEDSVIAGNTTEGVLVARGGALPGSAELYRCTVRDTKKNPASEDFARGIEVGKTGRLHVEGCTVMGNAEHEILVTEAAFATIVDTTTVGSTNTGAPSAPGLVVSYDGGAVATRYAAFRPRAAGIGLEENAVLTLNDSFISEPVVATLPTSTVGPQGMGISMKTNAILTMKGGAIHKAVGVSLLLSTARASLENVAIVDTLPRFGLGGRGVSVQDGSLFTALDSAIVGAHETGIVTFDPGSKAVLTGTTIEETKKDDFGSFGIAALATTSSMLELNACTITHSESIGLAVSSATAAVRGSWLSYNETGVHAQDGTSITTSREAALVDNVLSVSEDTRFISNAQNTGLGTVALPTK